MRFISQLEHAEALDRGVALGQRAARLLRPGAVRDGLHGVWLGHPPHPAEQHEQQMRVGVVQALANATAAGIYAASLLTRTPRAGGCSGLPGWPLRRPGACSAAT